MNRKNNSKDFCCPGFIPPGTHDDFCIPEECCPKRLDTPKFPSPSTCLPEERQRALEEKIERANELLLNLALSNKQPKEGRVRSFEGLTGQWVEIVIDRREKLDTEKKTVRKVSNKRKKSVWKRKMMRNLVTRIKRSKKFLKNKHVVKSKALVRKCYGRVHLVGRDFVLLKKKENDIIIPLSKVHSIKSISRFTQPTNEPGLLNIDPCLRRSITFNFGETVASSPELIQLFFKMTLPIFLLHLVDKKITVMLLEKKEQGIVQEVDKESLTLLTVKKEIKVIPFHSIYSIIT
ncbi:hypothetical protein L2D08_14390 [Domibacillus sp. PGB-M46]|uniref:hypothetical protein n=1 Tax=Domibacillus sp. PGB-M46 TaxID=2910255 RepID=UPI001F5661A8|nr:hypothetical protein [Domibacillus sp. PGB-M46]MCI2255559.1 hypothetical protein [Domibacillus sp. PGB-M46]